jgi:hypothetical protein
MPRVADVNVSAGADRAKAIQPNAAPEKKPIVSQQPPVSQSDLMQSSQIQKKRFFDAFGRPRSLSRLARAAFPR